MIFPNFERSWNVGCSVGNQCLTFPYSVFRVLRPHRRGLDGCNAARAPDEIPNI